MKKSLAILFTLLMSVAMFSCGSGGELNEETASKIIDDMVEVMMNADISDATAMEEEMKAVLDDYRITEQDWENYIEGNPGVEEELANKMMEAMFGSMGEMNLEGR